MTLSRKTLWTLLLCGGVSCGVAGVVTNYLHSPKGQEQAIPTRHAAYGGGEEPGPGVGPVWPPPVYFAAVAVSSNGLASEFSNEAVWKPTRGQHTVTLAWDRSPSPDLDHYLIYRGRASGEYTTNFNVGNCLTATIPLYAPVPTNLVVVVTTQNATNLQYCTALGLPWTLLGKTNYTATNPPMRLWRALGRKNTPVRVFLDAHWQ